MRKTKLTPEIQEKLLEALKAGGFYKSACASAGITFQTFLNWMEKGENSPSTIYGQFRDEILAVEAELEQRLVKSWVELGAKDWRAIAEFLGRRFPDRWSPQNNLKVQVEIEKQFNQFFQRVGADSSINPIIQQRLIQHALVVAPDIAIEDPEIDFKALSDEELEAIANSSRM